jgi:nicotinate-nucleotide adenylyltransferase
VDKRVVLFNIQNSALKTLCKIKDDEFSLPDLEIEQIIPLSARKEHKTFYKVLDEQEDFKGYEWVSILEIKKFTGQDGAIFCEALGKLWPLFQDKSYPIPEIFLKNTFSKESSIFYGGTFNPWHEGHSECLKKCSHKSIVIVPDSNPWKKNHFDQCYFESYKNICEKFKDTSYSVYPGFYGLENSNPTIDWLPKALVKKKSLLMGDDNFIKIFKWKSATALISELDSIHVLARDYPKVEFDKTREEVTLVNSEINIIYLGEHDFMNLSSTNLRKS